MFQRAFVLALALTLTMAYYRDGERPYADGDSSEQRYIERERSLKRWHFNPCDEFERHGRREWPFYAEGSHHKFRDEPERYKRSTIELLTGLYKRDGEIGDFYYGRRHGGRDGRFGCRY